MGYQISLRTKVIIKKEYREDMSIVLSERSWKNCSHEIMKSIAVDFRDTLMHCDHEGTMPNQWKGNADGFETRFYPETGLLTFQTGVSSNCTQSNFEGEWYDAPHVCDHFINNILNEIADKVLHLEIYDDLERTPKNTNYFDIYYSHFYDFKDGKIEELDKGVLYNELYEEDFDMLTPEEKLLCSDYNSVDYNICAQYRKGQYIK